MLESDELDGAWPEELPTPRPLQGPGTHRGRSRQVGQHQSAARGAPAPHKTPRLTSQPRMCKNAFFFEREILARPKSTQWLTVLEGMPTAQTVASPLHGYYLLGRGVAGTPVQRYFFPSPHKNMKKNLHMCRSGSALNRLTHSNKKREESKSVTWKKSVMGANKWWRVIQVRRTLWSRA
jgi:hypothetical protein